MYNIIIKNIWTEHKIVYKTVSGAYNADRIAMRLFLKLKNYIAYMEPVNGWDAETKK